ncbi:Iron-binding zinc finger CDGSH type domain-containing protein [Caenorhabditis elegans]|uniref:Iron-binding zinc finger CDGSH type domain-containing protein n=1 Tax=Caenorhabditis elegans TaxID=6239 RepID=Q9BKQ9_CAEEL|nr:Iron-binding zinc finger CDGSH type domain-containing protein [Caenorhabditis elegans]CCD73028.1 Iron-binding zinc finger CDGSH type domain-containing protein [Caenorhabditis elegans]|eukprot:NP_497419.1 CDGSH Iron Sulfur Domain protein homolog [Caenorhabditis elegans]
MLGRTCQKLQAAAPIQSSIRGKARGVVVQSYSADVLPYKGQPAGTKSNRVKLEAGKTYHWCSCGLSITQPFCDGTHKTPGLTNVRPVSFQVEKTGIYPMCDCKQTGTRPICDGKHADVSKAPRDLNATRMVAFDESPVYAGVAQKLGYKPKNGGFQ